MLAVQLSMPRGTISADIYKSGLGGVRQNLHPAGSGTAVDSHRTFTKGCHHTTSASYHDSGQLPCIDIAVLVLSRDGAR